MRKILEFSKGWKFTKDVTDGAAVGAKWDEVDLPHTWNNVDGQDGGNDYYRGTCMYAKKFTRPEITSGQRVIIEFLGAALSAKVSFNNKELTNHEDGFSTFRVDVTDYLEDENVIMVAVDNSATDRIYPQKADFTFYGGIYRDVNMIIVEENHFEIIKDGTTGIKITPVVNLESKSAEIKCEAWTVGGDKVAFTVGDLTAEADVNNGYASCNIHMENIHLWDGINDPYLYDVQAKLIVGSEATDEVSTRIGLRKYEFDTERGFILNGREYPLRGVSRHQDRAGVGNAITQAMHDEDMEIIKEIGANTIRLAHYQHAQYFYDLCDENGMIVWAEIPFITQFMPNGYDNTILQMRELITQCYHHPSIICWGLSNEITASGSITDELYANHKALNDLCHEMDETRVTTMAHAFMLEPEDKLIEMADLGSYNLYYGWYLGELEENDEFFDDYHKNYPNRIIGFSEYGADANPAFQSSNPEKGDYTETYQCVYHEHILKCINERPFLWATHVWNMFDFAADGRDEGGKNGQNQKGLVTMDRKLKKDAFYLYKANWNKTDKFVHLCGSRYKDRVEAETEVKVYSNLDKVTLFLDGNEVATTETDMGTAVFKINISGNHVVEARGNDGNTEYKDIIEIHKVDEANPAYGLLKKEEVINWFDKDTIDPNYYSINDTLGALKENPQSAAIVNNLMAKLMASRGEVAEATAGNKTLEKMLNKMTLVALFKQAGDTVPRDMIKQLNDTLQKIKK
ncbi:MAG: glycoside hydrolase family 2 protein [Lachnospiraceae bacterium]|nr:glycoside hydrolase family 2 protein [Lachnospiraceae bacterium]